MELTCPYCGDDLAAFPHVITHKLFGVNVTTCPAAPAHVLVRVDPPTKPVQSPPEEPDGR